MSNKTRDGVGVVLLSLLKRLLAVAGSFVYIVLHGTFEVFLLSPYYLIKYRTQKNWLYGIPALINLYMIDNNRWR